MSRNKAAECTKTNPSKILSISVGSLYNLENYPRGFRPLNREQQGQSSWNCSRDQTQLFGEFEKRERYFDHQLLRSNGSKPFSARRLKH
jgi:hypothetical protein